MCPGGDVNTGPIGGMGMGVETYSRDVAHDGELAVGDLE